MRTYREARPSSDARCRVNALWLLVGVGGCVLEPASDPPITPCVEVALETGTRTAIPADTRAVCLFLDGSRAFLPQFGATTEMREGSASGSVLILTDVLGVELAQGAEITAGANPERTANALGWYLDTPMREVVLEIHGAHPALTVGLSDQND